MRHDSRQSAAIAGRTTLREPGAADYIGLTQAYLRATRSGRGTPGPPYVRIGRTIVYRISDLDAWLEEHRVVPRERQARRR
jgi:hypothetical protein